MGLFERITRIATIVLLGVLCFTLFTIAEEITLTTYYPAPNGAYVDLSATNSLVIGSSYAGTETAPADGMLVEGNVGIGSTNPSQELDVNGTIAATGLSISGTVDATDYSAGGTAGWNGSYSTGGQPETITVTNGIITDVS